MEKFATFQGRLEDHRFVTGQGYYATDLSKEGMTHAVVARAAAAPARLVSVDVSAARAHPGVLAVLTSDDLVGGPTHMPCGPNLPMTNGEPAYQAARPVLAIDRVRYVGEAVAFVVAETAAAAWDAAELVEIEYEEETPVTTALDARADGAPAVHCEVPDNVAYVWTRGDHGAARAAIDAAPRTVSLSSHVSRVAVHSMEPRACLAYVAADGRLTLESCSQSPHAIKGGLAGIFELDPSMLRVITHDVGGSFGMKIGAYVEDVLCLFTARSLGLPVKWVSDRTEAALVDDHGRDMRFDAQLGFNDDGDLLGLRVHWDINIGAYLQGRSLGGLGNMGGISGVYRIGPTAAECYGVYTNTHTTGPFRGAGRPEATYCIERLLDLAAAELGIEPFELRRRNLVPADAMPWNTGFLFDYDCGEFEENMNVAAQLADLTGYLERQAISKAAGKLRGIGFSNPIEVAGGPFVNPGADHCRITVNGDGSAVIHPGAMSVGQGLETAFSTMVADALALDLSRIDYRQGDTDDLPGGRGSGGSASAPTGGSALVLAMDKVIEKGKTKAADMLEVAPDDVEFADGCYRVAGTDREVTLPGVAAKMEEAGETLDGQSHFVPSKVTFPNGCHICEVEIDPETGVVTVERYTVAEDVGKALSPVLLSGQMHGGIAMGVGQTMMERMYYDPASGQPLTATFMDYAMPRADLLPELNFTIREVPTKVNPVGAKGVGEAGSVGSLAASANAVANALSPLGIRHVEMPMTPARIWQAIQDARSAA